MRPKPAHLAIDLGAESGRIVAGVLDGDRLDMHEVHRFEHRPIMMRSGLHWDFCGIWREVLAGLRLSGQWAHANGREIRSIGADTWGVDHCFLSEGGSLLGLPRCYRDPRFEAGFAGVTARVPARQLYEMTGIQPMPINTIFQLHVRREQDPELDRGARHFAMFPDLLHVMLGGRPCSEITIASTSQLLDVRRREWSQPLLSGQSLRPDHFLKCDAPGTGVGPLDAGLASGAGLTHRPEIILPASHDTASAVAAIPATHGRPWCYLSSGTWSLMGVERSDPIITDEAFQGGFSNELGVPLQAGGTPSVRFQKNIAGLWLVQECRRAFEAAGDSLDYASLARAAADAAPWRTVLDVNHPPFLFAGGMPGKIAAHAADTRQPIPSTHGELIRACLESLALEYRRTLRRLERIIACQIEVIHLVGGGGKNRLLNQMTADATGKRVVVGPYEATAMGNLLVQSMGHAGAGSVRDVPHRRRIVSVSSEVQTYEPRDHAAWQPAADRYESLLRKP